MKTPCWFYLIEGGTWPYDVIVALGPTEDEFFKYCEKRFSHPFTEDEKASFAFEGKKGRTLRLENNAIVIWMPVIPQNAQEIGNLAHEIYHAAYLMLTGAGVVPSNDSDEAFAYQIDFLTRKIWQRYFF